ncbi:hypothetical protein [Streptomyces sp. NPDC020742]|uniref:hypothetical protein n=1 Tax=Streptomyces sp. NPDC020742 TaxID=3154897 RepID=UPI0033FB585E
MTQHGQGPDPQNPAAGPAREGIVLPANGEPYVPDQQAAPAAGQPWGQPWGPEQQAAPTPAPQAAPAPAPPAYGQQPDPAQGYGGPQGYAPTTAQAAVPQQPSQPPGGLGYPQQPQGQPPVPPLPPSVPQQAPQQPGPAGALPPESPSYGGQQLAAQPYGQAPHTQPGQAGELVRATPQTGAPLPPPAGDAEATTVIPPYQGAPGGPGAAGDAEATTVIPPYQEPAGGTGGALPPEAATRPETPDESTTMLRAIKPGQAGPRGGAQPMPASQPMPGAGGGSDAEATQMIPPVGAGAPGQPPGAPYGVRPGAPGDRPTPSEFDGLFRDGPGLAQPAAPDSTAQLPRFEDPGRPPYGNQPPAHGQQFPPGGGYDAQPSYEDGGGGRRRLPAAAVVGIVIVALAGVGLGVGWAVSGGGSDEPTQKQDTGKGSTRAAGQKDEPKETTDPAEAQTKGLDALLGDSNNSRSSVIGAVNSIKSCQNLGGAAKDLRAAAGQRNDLVKRLQQLPVDKIPNHAQLTAALTKAWQSSAAADNHYAAWAGQVGGKKGCHKGKARMSRQTAQGNTASGQATQAKRQAAQIWNPLAQKYGLTERRPEQL